MRASNPARTARRSGTADFMVQTFGTGIMADAKLERIVAEVFDLTPAGIIKALRLRRPIYSPTAAYGHFGRRPKTIKVDGKRVGLFPWEETNRVRDLLTAAKA